MADYIATLPDYSHPLNNTWVNPYDVSGIDFYSKSGWNDLSTYLGGMPVIATQIPIFGHYISGGKYYANSSDSYSILPLGPGTHIVHNTSSNPEFVNLQEPTSSTDTTPIFPYNTNPWGDDYYSHLVSLGILS